MVCPDLTLLFICSLDRPNVGRRAPRRPTLQSIHVTYLVSGPMLQDNGRLIKDEVSFLLPMMPAAAGEVYRVRVGIR
jgi:hypothetical protein